MELVSKIQKEIDEYFDDMFDNIKYGLLSQEDIDSLSVMNISVNDIKNFNSNKKQLDDKFENPDLGVHNIHEICPTCNQRSADCPGHFATIELPFYMVNPIFSNDLVSVLNCICLSCSRLLIGSKKILSIIAKLPKHQRLKALAVKSKGLHCTRKCSEIVRDGDEVNLKECPKIFSEFSYRKNEAGSGNIKTVKIKFLPNSKIFCDVNCDVIYKILEAIPIEDVKIMGLGESHPKLFLMNKVLVIPPKTRPTIADGNKVYPDGLTKAYKEIVNSIGTYLLNDIKKADFTTDELLKNYNITDDLQILKDIYQSSHDFSLKIPILNSVSNLINSNVPLGRTSSKTSTTSSYTKKLNGKFGLLRRYMMGKRVNHTGRTVVGPSPDFDVDEIGVPKFIAQNLTKRVYVNDINYDLVMKWLDDGKIKSFIKTSGKQKDMRFLIGNGKAKFEKGDIIERELMNGDYVLANRNPTIHKQGMMGLKVRIVNENIFRLNLALTPPLNADFDGDDLNIFVPQTIHSHAELATIVSAEGSYGDSQSSKLMVGLVFDAVTGCFNLTQDFTYLDENKFHNIVFNCNIQDDYLENKNYDYGHGFVKTVEKYEKCIDIVYKNLYIYIDKNLTDTEFIEIRNKVDIFEKQVEEMDIQYSEDDEMFKVEFIDHFETVFDREYDSGNIIDVLIFKYFSLESDVYKFMISCYVEKLIFEYLDNKSIKLNKNNFEYLMLFLDKLGFYYNLKNEHVDKDVKFDTKSHYFDKCLEKGIDIYSGKSLFSILLPYDFYYQKIKSTKTDIDMMMFQVKIENGILYQGSLNKEHVGTSPNSIPHILFLYKDYRIVTKFLTYAQRMINHWFNGEGFSIGLSDCILEENTKAKINDSLNGIRLNAINQVLNIKTETESLKEEKIISVLQEVRLLNDNVIKELSVTSPLLIMAELAKAKGKGANLVQIIAAIGQQYYKGARIANETPYFSKKDPDPIARGLCLSSFVDGMTPSEFVFHMYSSREGLTDSALKTADCGSEHHNLAKALEILNVKEDMTIRNVSNRIVQFSYGDDGFDAEQLHSVKGTNQQSTFVDINLLVNTFNSMMS